MKRIPVVAQGIGAALYISVILGAFIYGFTLTPELDRLLNGKTAPLPLFHSVWTLIEQEFCGNLPSAEARMRGAVRGMLATLNDPYTVILYPQPAKQEQQTLAGRYGDIGVTLWWAPEGLVGLSPYANGPAKTSGVREGDRLLTLDGAELATDTLNLDQLSWQLQGEVSTTVTLGLLRLPSQTLTITVMREEVLHPSVQARVADPANDIGYLNIMMFTTQTSGEIEEVLHNLSQLGIRALVLDLRGNYGGVVAPLSRVGGMFLPAASPLYYVIARNQEKTIFVQGEPLFNGPLVVLVDGGTASAAEILAGALQDHERALLVGSLTYGKGSIQSLYPLSDGSHLHVTSAVWLTPQRQRLDGNGLKPDLEIAEQVGKDKALEVALTYLRNCIQ